MVRLDEISKEELRKFQEKLTGMMAFLDRVCRENGLTYYMTEGSCLGAVRHQGFIPWDDDLDIALPRPDYEKLWEIWQRDYRDSRYVLCRTTKDVCIKFHIMTLRDSATTCIYPHSTDIDTCHGIKIDICPLDGVPGGFLKEKMQTVNTKLFGLFAAQRIPNQEGSKITKVVAKIALGLIKSPRVRYSLWSGAEKRFSRYDYDSCDYVRSLNARPLPKKIFGEPRFVPFEGYSFAIPEDYDAYLKDCYGDYMQLPPEEKRKPSRTVLEVFDLERPYTDYKGSGYLKKD